MSGPNPKPAKPAATPAASSSSTSGVRSVIPALRDEISRCVSGLVSPRSVDGAPARSRAELKQLACGVASDLFNVSLPEGQINYVTTKAVERITQLLNKQDPPETPSGGGGAAAEGTPATAGAEAPACSTDKRVKWGDGKRKAERDPEAKLMDTKQTPPTECLYFRCALAEGDEYAASFKKLLTKRFSDGREATQLTAEELDAMLQAAATELQKRSSEKAGDGGSEAKPEVLLARIKELEASEANLAKQVAELQQQLHKAEFAVIYSGKDPDGSVDVYFYGPPPKEEVMCLEKHYYLPDEGEEGARRDADQARTVVVSMSFGEKDIVTSEGTTVQMVDHAVVVLTVDLLHLEEKLTPHISKSRTLKVCLVQEAESDVDGTPICYGKSYDYLTGILCYSFKLKPRPVVKAKKVSPAPVNKKRART